MNAPTQQTVGKTSHGNGGNVVQFTEYLLAARPVLLESLEYCFKNDLPVIPLAVGGFDTFAGYMLPTPFAGRDEAVRFLNANPNANFGVWTGEESNLVVFSVWGAPGLKRFKALCKKHGSEISPVRSVWRDHVVFWFDVDRGFKIPADDEFGPDVSLLCDWTYALLPGSIIGGELCVFEHGGAPWEKSVPPLPGFVA